MMRTSAWNHKKRSLALLVWRTATGCCKQRNEQDPSHNRTPLYCTCCGCPTGAVVPSSAFTVLILIPSSAGVAKLAYAADSKWDFCSFCPLRNSSQPLAPTKENDLDG